MIPKSDLCMCIELYYTWLLSALKLSASFLLVSGEIDVAVVDSSILQIYLICKFSDLPSTVKLAIADPLLPTT